jgi:hypothetical protein
LHDEFTIYRFDFAFVDLAKSSLGLLCPERIDPLLIRTVETSKQMVSEHCAFATR